MAYQQQQQGGVYPSAPPQQPQGYAQQQYPGATYPQATPMPPPQQGYAPPPQGMPPPQQGMPPPQQAMAPPQQAMVQPPAGPQLPFGYNIKDAFRGGNVVQLIPRSTGFPLVVRTGAISGNGTFVKNDSLFRVVIPDKGGLDTFMLQNVEWKGMHVAIKSHKVQATKSDKNCVLRVHVQPDNYVVFESVQTPGEFVAIQKNGAPPDKVKGLGQYDEVVQFFVRVQGQKHPHSQTIMTPFGRPSIANQLRDGSYVQLYLKPTNTFLSINSNGMILSTTNGGDKHTFFELLDRGMGIVSLHSKEYSGYRLRMNNFVLEGKGDPTLLADWRLLENANGTVQFESVTSQGAFVCINQGGVLHKEISIFLMNIQRFGGAETITKTPLN